MPRLAKQRPACLLLLNHDHFCGAANDGRRRARPSRGKNLQSLAQLTPRRGLECLLNCSVRSKLYRRNGSYRTSIDLYRQESSLCLGVSYKQKSVSL